MKKMLMVGLAAALFMAINVGLSLFLTNLFLINGSVVAEAADPAGGASKPGASKRTAVKAKNLEPAIYVPLSPVFTANFGDPKRGRYISLELEAMTRDPEVEEAITTHLPAIRSSILLLLGALSGEQIATTEAKDALRAEIRDTIRKILMRNGAKSSVEQVFFTSLVMQ